MAHVGVTVRLEHLFVHGGIPRDDIVREAVRRRLLDFVAASQAGGETSRAISRGPAERCGAFGTMGGRVSTLHASDAIWAFFARQS